MNKQTQNNLLKIVKRNYNEIADDFSETRKKKLWPELIKLAGAVKDGDPSTSSGQVKVLDVGCGSGRLLEAFKNKKINYLGIDDSEKLINLAKKKNQNFIVGNILELNKISELNFNYVFCIAVLHHLPGKDLQINALKQLKNKITPDGKIILTVWNLWSQLKFRKLILKFYLLKLIGKNKMDAGDILFDWKNSKGEVVSKRYYHGFRKKELRKIIKKSGLRIEKIYKDKYNYYAVLKK
ncbi:MAG: methyltransferase domain-containing protein [Candidatus Falkowbacteria bacterium]